LEELYKADRQQKPPDHNPKPNPQPNGPPRELLELDGYTPVADLKVQFARRRRFVGLAAEHRPQPLGLRVALGKSAPFPVAKGHHVAICADDDHLVLPPS